MSTGSQEYPVRKQEDETTKKDSGSHREHAVIDPIHSLEICGTMPLTKVNNGRVQDVVTNRGNTKYRVTSLSIFIKFKEAFKVVTREVVVVALLPVIGTERCGAVVPPNPKVEPIECAL